MKINWHKSILAGLIGTLLFDLLGLLLTGQWWDIPTLLGAKLGVGLTGGVFGHYANGAAIAVIYAAMRPSLFGPNWFRGVSFITAQTVLGVWLFMLPLLGAGIAGIDANPLLPVISLSRHLLYAVPLIIILRTEVAESPSAPQCAIA